MPTHSPQPFYFNQLPPNPRQPASASPYIPQQSYSYQPQAPKPEPKRRNGFLRNLTIGGTITFIAALLSIFAYFGLSPSSHPSADFTPDPVQTFDYHKLLGTWKYNSAYGCVLLNLTNLNPDSFEYTGSYSIAYSGSNLCNSSSNPTVAYGATFSDGSTYNPGRRNGINWSPVGKYYVQVNNSYQDLTCNYVFLLTVNDLSNPTRLIGSVKIDPRPNPPPRSCPLADPLGEVILSQS